MKSSLEETAQALMVLAEHESEVEALTHGLALPAAPHEEALSWQFVPRRRRGGTVAQRARRAVARAAVRGSSADAEPRRVHDRGAASLVQVARPLAELRRAQALTATEAAGAVLLLNLVAALVLAWQIGRGLKPVQRLAADVEAIEPGPVAPRLPRSPRRGLEPVYLALERLGQRLALQLRSERAFSAHAAHSLRTPLAGLSAQIELLLLRAPVELHPSFNWRSMRRGGSPEWSRRFDDGANRRPGAPARLRRRSLVPAALARRIAVDMPGSKASACAAIRTCSPWPSPTSWTTPRHGAGRVSLSAARDATHQRIEVTTTAGVWPTIASPRSRGHRRFDASGLVDDTLGLGSTLAAMVGRAHGASLELGPMPGGAGFFVRLEWPSAAFDAEVADERRRASQSRGA